MNPKGTETILSDENRLLKEKIKSLQNEVQELKKNREIEEKVDLAPIVRLILFALIAVCLYPFFRFGWFLLTNNF